MGGGGSFLSEVRRGLIVPARGVHDPAGGMPDYFLQCLCLVSLNFPELPGSIFAILNFKFKMDLGAPLAF